MGVHFYCMQLPLNAVFVRGVGEAILPREEEACLAVEVCLDNHLLALALKIGLRHNHEIAIL